MSRAATVVSCLLLAALMAGAVWVGGWWGVPVAAALYAALRRARPAPRETMLAAGIATVALFVPRATDPAFTRLLTGLGSLFPMPGPAVLALAIALPMVLAYASARVAIGIVGVRETR